MFLCRNQIRTTSPMSHEQLKAKVGRGSASGFELAFSVQYKCYLLWGNTRVASIEYDVHHSMWSKSVEYFCQMQPQGQVLSAEDEENILSEVPRDKFMALMVPYFQELACLYSHIHGLHRRLHDFMMYPSFGLPLVLFYVLRFYYNLHIILHSFHNNLHGRTQSVQWAASNISSTTLTGILGKDCFKTDVVAEQVWIRLEITIRNRYDIQSQVIWTQQHGSRSAPGVP